ncbi:hypothetical protein, partial [Pseudomonas aeruginosa]|uniref:hypothetical protein n=4 Tax=Pseudomonas aeruginosa TaxID=287 RepID=UPI001C49E8FC
MLENQGFTDSLPGGGEALRQVVRRSGSVPKGIRNEASPRCLTANLNAVECAIPLIGRWFEGRRKRLSRKGN